ncbi:MAG TPA: HAD family hydrolase [Candidatus Micrarchaeaceae archaeon]|nr:HAD family hydrolase [Candidatus Micrarchaeaceae archaeon]
MATLFHARAVLFDWDGTLLNSYDSDARAYLSMFRAMGIPWTIEDLNRNYSPNWLRVYEAARLPREKWEEADRLWHQAYEDERPELLPGAEDVVESLRTRFQLGIVTSGSRDRVLRQLREFELAPAFCACVCSEDAARRKPDPAPLEVALARMRVRPEESVYVGDSPEDIEMARAAGVRAIGVLGPFPTAERVRALRPDALLESIEELPHLLALTE